MSNNRRQDETETRVGPIHSNTNLRLKEKIYFGGL